MTTGTAYTDGENLVPTGILSPYRPVRSESLYELNTTTTTTTTTITTTTTTAAVTTATTVATTTTTGTTTAAATFTTAILIQQLGYPSPSPPYKCHHSIARPL
jgi:hypothetical protein